MQAQIHAEVERALSIARLMGGDYELQVQVGTPPMMNAPEVVQVIQQAASDLIGAESLLPPKDSLGAEDFGCFSEIAPGAMFSLGCKIEGDERYLHNPRFDIDERCLPIFSRDLLAKIQGGDPSWEPMVPPQVAQLIKERGMFGWRA